ncbi:MAG: glycerol acyltransferase [Actinobacteria bacterium 13_2_20CM_2_72_6]|nr:MAG: glycerol acyltransferase [Actinobacteria bacterium 13_2_20CM_2_72_6]
MRPPARWIRRVLLAPPVIVLALALVATAPVWALVTVVLSPFSTGHLRPLRLLWLATVYLLVEAYVLGALFALWLGSGFGWKVRGPAFQRLHYRLCGTVLRTLYRQARWVLRLSVRIEGTDPASAPRDRPLLVLCRHAGPGDSFLLAHALINWYDREPRIVLKDTLQWDPAIDVLLNRLPSTFIAPARERRDETEAQIGALATGLDGEAMHNVLPPRPGGVLAALDAAPDADVMLVAHTGVDHLLTVADVWRELPMDKRITMQWWLEPASAVPVTADERVDWLYAWWARIDAWVVENRPVELPWPSLTHPAARR